MTHLDFIPRVDGDVYDPVSNGGTVGQLQMMALWGSSFTVAATVPSPVKVDEGLYRYTLPATLVESRYWPRVTWTPNGTSAAAVEHLPGVAVPGWEATGRIVTPWDVAVELGLTFPLTDLQTVRLQQAIDTAQGKVSGFLNRPLLPTLTTFPGQYPSLYYDQASYNQSRAWPGLVAAADDTVQVESWADDGPLGWTVQAWVGLNAATDPALEAVRGYVAADAAWRAITTPAAAASLGVRSVTTVSADGQSVTYDKPAGGQGDTMTLGAPPDKSVLDRWRRRAVYTRRTYPAAPWPYNGAGGVRVVP